MEGQWRIHYFILHLRDLLPQDYKAFCITWKSKACSREVECISLVLLFYFLIFTTKLYPVLSFNDSYHRCLELLHLSGFSFPCRLGTMVLDSHCVNTRCAKTAWGCLRWTWQSKQRARCLPTSDTEWGIGLHASNATHPVLALIAHVHYGNVYMTS